MAFRRLEDSGSLSSTHTSLNWGKKPLFLVRLLSQLQTALLDVCLQPSASISVVLWSQTHQNIPFFRSSFVSKHIPTESSEDYSVWGALGTREIWEKTQGVSSKDILFSSEWIPPKLVVCLEMTAIARTVAKDPLLACFMRIASASGKHGAGNFMAQKNIFKDLWASLSKIREARKTVRKQNWSLIRILQILENGWGVPTPQSVVSEQGNVPQFSKLPSKKQLKHLKKCSPR